jgi:outer membrane protein assembly factor BamB
MNQRRHGRIRGALALFAACGAAAAAPSLSSAATGPAPVNWPTFDFNAGRTGVGPADTGITAANVGKLKRQTLTIPGTVDSSPIELTGVRVAGKRRDVFFVTDQYGETLAIDARSGHTLWKYTPASRLAGDTQPTTATPVADPDDRFIYVATPDGFIRKLSIARGHPVWATKITDDATREKIGSALNISGDSVLAETEGYDGDTPTYQGHVVTLSRSSGRMTHVWNSLCSNVKGLIDPPSKCHASDSGIWGRSGAVVDSRTGDLLVATANGPFNGKTDWGDSVLELSPSLKLLHNWTPSNQGQLNSGDVDLGSTSPTLIDLPGGKQLAVQGGKSGVLNLLNVAALDGTRRHAGPRTGGQLQTINAPGPTDVFSQPITDRIAGHQYVFVTTGDGTAAYVLGGNDRLRETWSDSDPGTSPVIAGGLLYIYDMDQGTLIVRNPRTGHIDAQLPAKPGHWNSPIVDGGEIILPEGNDNDNLSKGTIDIYRLPH